MDDDLDDMTREQLVAEVVRLRTAVRTHRDSSGTDARAHDADYDA